MKALVVIDCQNDFLRRASPYACEMLDGKLVANIRKLIEMCRGRMPVVYTRHSIRPDKSNAEPGEPKKIRACIEGTKGWEIIEDIAPHAGDAVVRKTKFDAFFGSDLENKLRKFSVDTLILCGVHTNNCVRATAEGAYYRGYKLILVSDCCGCSSFVRGMKAEKVSKFTLEELGERTYGTRITTLSRLKALL